MIKTLHATYCHGSENYFILIDGFTKPLDFEEADFQQFTLAAIEQITNQPIDGILYLLPSLKADARMRIFNKDGSEAEMCGNGFRCLGKKLYESTGRTKYHIETLIGILKGEKAPDIYKNIDSYSVLMPDIQFDYNGQIYNKTHILELDAELKFTSVNMGNPHLIAEVTDIDINKLSKIGQQVNDQCQLFPNGNNISFYKVIGPNKLFVATYERGVGLTNACGTAMAATSLVAAKHKQIEMNQWTTIVNPGGMVKCLPEYEGETYQVSLLGNATFIHDYQITYDSKNRQIIKMTSLQSYPEALKHYSQFKNEVHQ
jgi:diaminopimelate epimerase